MRHSSTEVFDEKVQVIGQLHGAPVPGQFLDIRPFLSRSLNLHDSGVTAMRRQQITGIDMNNRGRYGINATGDPIPNDRYNPERPLLLATWGQDYSVLGSFDYGATWFTAAEVPGQNTTTNIRTGICGGKTYSDNYEALIGWSASVTGISNLQAIHSANQVADITHSRQTFSDLESDSLGLCVAVDFHNETWWVAGQTAGGVLRVAYRAFGTPISSAGTWTEYTITGLPRACSLVVGPGEPWSTSGGTVVLAIASGSVGKYAYTTGASPEGWLVRDVTAFFNYDIRSIVYNAYWDKYILVRNTLAAGPVALVCAPGDLGSTTAADYEVRTAALGSAEQFYTTVSLSGMGSSGAVGPWCYFQCTDNKVVGTPDMGKTWYFFQPTSIVEAAAASAGAIPLTSVGDDGNRIITCSSGTTSGEWYSVITGALNAHQPFLKSA